jgi:hypothetical protein
LWYFDESPSPAGGITRYACDSQHRMTAITDARGITFLENTYYQNSRACQQQQADGGIFTHYVTADIATTPESIQLARTAAVADEPRTRRSRRQPLDSAIAVRRTLDNGRQMDGIVAARTDASRAASACAPLPERDARALLFVRALEEADRDGIVLAPRDRAAATRRAFEHGVARGTAPVLVDRARLLCGEVLKATPALARVVDPPRLRRGIVPLTIAVAAVTGVATNLWGPERHVSVLAFPLAGVLAWNLLVYAGLAAKTLLVATRREPWAAARDRLVSLGTWLDGLRPSPVARWFGRDARSRVVADAVARFHRLWIGTAAPLLAARARLVLHLGALSLAAGAVLGMYLAGIRFDYRATWESTWLDSGAVQGYVDIVLGPASRVLGIPVPDVAPLRAPGAGSAAPWIHLWAATIGLVVVVPRTALAVVETERARRLARRLPVDLDAGYYRRAVAAATGSGLTADVVYYSCEPASPLRTRLHALLQELAGARASIRERGMVAYGDRLEGIASSLVVVVFTLAQTPEPEVHGEFLERLQGAVEHAGATLLVVLESSSYRARVGSDERVRERRGTWERLLRTRGLAAVELDEVATGDERRIDEWVEMARRAFWPDERVPARL